MGCISRPGLSRNSRHSRPKTRSVGLLRLAVENSGNRFEVRHVLLEFRPVTGQAEQARQLSRAGLGGRGIVRFDHQAEWSCAGRRRFPPRPSECRGSAPSLARRQARGQLRPQFVHHPLACQQAESEALGPPCRRPPRRPRSIRGRAAARNSSGKQEYYSSYQQETSLSLRVSSPEPQVRGSGSLLLHRRDRYRHQHAGLFQGEDASWCDRYRSLTPA